MDQCKKRFSVSIERIHNAGFSNTKRWKAVDAYNDDIVSHWAHHGSPIFDKDDKDFVKKIGKQGCALGHYNIWEDIIRNEYDYAIVFEDDIDFHTDWKILAPHYWSETPDYFDILFMGTQFVGSIPQTIVSEEPTYFTHAYIITFHGACILYDLCLNDKPTRTIDCMLYDNMLSEEPCFAWVCWNGKTHPDKKKKKHLQKSAKKNCGLVFQDPMFRSLIE